MNLYLAWSLEQLVVALVIGISLLLLAMRSLVSEGFIEKPLSLGKRVACILAFLVVILFMAVNVGQRQSELGRSSFNGDAPLRVDKVERDDLNSEKVSELFRESLKDNPNRAQ